MSETFADLSHLSREELYSLVNALKRLINCLSTDLMRYELISKKCRKYLTDLLNVREINIHLTQELLKYIELNGKQSVISVTQPKAKKKRVKHLPRITP